MASILSFGIAMLLELGIFVGFAYLSHYARSAFVASERIRKKKIQSDEALEIFVNDLQAKQSQSRMAVDAVLDGQPFGAEKSYS